MLDLRDSGKDIYIESIEKHGNWNGQRKGTEEMCKPTHQPEAGIYGKAD